MVREAERSQGEQGKLSGPRGLRELRRLKSRVLTNGADGVVFQTLDGDFLRTKFRIQGSGYTEELARV